MRRQREAWRRLRVQSLLLAAVRQRGARAWRVAHGRGILAFHVPAPRTPLAIGLRAAPWRAPPPTVPTMGAGWCPPGMLGIGIGGTAEKAALLAKESLMDPIDIHEIRQRGPQNKIEELRLEIMDKVNNLGIGAQGLGGLTTVVDVKIKTAPTHAAKRKEATNLLACRKCLCTKI